jgi:hypothetical protein
MSYAWGFYENEIMENVHFSFILLYSGNFNIFSVYIHSVLDLGETFSERLDKPCKW